MEQAQVQKNSASMAPFFAIWTGQALSLMGSNLVQFALVWWLTQSTGSATVLAFATMMALLPQIFLSPFAGALIDRWNRRIVMIVADSAIALATIVLAALYALDVVQVWHIYLLMLIRAAGGAFHWPAMQASTTLMVPEKHLSRIAGMNQTLFGLINIAAPPLGALLLGILPMQGILAIDVGTALIAVTPLLFVAIPQPVRKGAAGEQAPTSVLTDLREGLRYVWGWPGLMLILLVATLINLLINPAFTLLPIMVTGHFGGGALHLAWLETGWGVGMVVGGITLSLWGGFKRRIVTGLSALALMGLGVIAIGLTPTTGFLLAVGALVFSGFMNPIVNGSLLATLQAIVPPEMQGRVFTLISSGAAAMSPLGLAIAGPVADAFGVQFWFLIGGVATVLMGVGTLFVPAIREIENRKEGQAGMDVESAQEAAQEAAQDVNVAQVGV